MSRKKLPPRPPLSDDVVGELLGSTAGVLLGVAKVSPRAVENLLCILTEEEADRLCCEVNRIMCQEDGEEKGEAT